jgi:sec-independent protein translocase protein TatA
MFGIGGSELLFIVFIILMLFGSDKIPEIARSAGKFMKHLKHATNDIKSEIQRSAEANGIDTNSITGGISEEIEKVKQSFSDTVDSTGTVDTNFTTEIEKVKEDIEQITGPIKRQF